MWSSMDKLEKSSISPITILSIYLIRMETHLDTGLNLIKERSPRLMKLVPTKP